MKTKIIAVVVLVIVAVGSYFIGLQSGKSSVNDFAKSRVAGFALRGENGIRADGSGSTMGKILSIDSNSMTVGLQNGGSKIVLLGVSTRVQKTVEGTIKDLAVGTNIVVFGTANSDGSETATSIQIRPQGLATSTRGQ